jgi:hypothetical protein
MPRYFINFLNSNGILSEDDVGQDLPGLEEAEAAATVSAREILADNIKGAADVPLVAITITNQSGEELKRIAAKDVLPKPLK